jgi:hypothetical protein
MLTEFRSKVSKFLVDNSASILTGVGAIGTVSTAVLAGQATFKAARILIEEEERIRITPDEEPLTFREKVSMVWTFYIPAVGSGVLTIVSMVTATRIGNRRVAAMAAAYSMSEIAFQEYKEKVYEKFGQTKERQVRDEVAQDRVAKNRYADAEVIITDNAQQLFMDSYSGRYFMSSMDVLKKAENELNHYLIHHVYASLSDFYDKVGLPHTGISDDVGWHSNRLLELSFSATISDDDRACIVMDFNIRPVSNYESLN